MSLWIPVFGDLWGQPWGQLFTAVPSMELHLTAGQLNSNVTFTRASSGTYFDSSGVMQTAGDNSPRFDHDPVTHAAKGLLIEPSRSNLALNSALSGGVSGTPGTPPTSWAQYTTGTPAVNYGSDAVFSGGNSVTMTCANERQQIAQTVSVAANTTYCFSAAVNLIGSVSLYNLIGLLAPPSGSTVAYYVDGVLFANPNLSPTEGFHKLLIVLVNGATAGTCSLRLGIGVSANTTGTVTFNKPQFEVGAYPTSYIQTVASQVTRAADTAVITTTSWLNPLEGTLIAELTPMALAASSGIQLNDNTVNNQIRLAATSTTDQGTITTGGVSQAVLDGGTPVAGTSMKMALAYKANDFALSLNGGNAVTDTSGTVPTVTQLQIGAETTTVGGLTIKNIAYYQQRLPDATLKVLTT